MQAAILPEDLQGGKMNENSLDWVKPYYTRAGEYWAPLGDDPSYTQRLETLTRLCGSEPKRILELGAGCGETAAIMADAGHDVVAVEFSPTRATNIQLLADQPRSGRLTAFEADFYEVELSPRFDVVCYWDGFGIGSDKDQRRLLKRFASEWLKPDGCALIEVFNPYRWSVEAGKEWRLDRNHPSHKYRQRRRFDFDPVNGSFVDQWCPIDDATDTCDESMAITQIIRCYNPADLSLLLEGTGLQVDLLEVDGQPINGTLLSGSALWKAWSYLARLIPQR